MDDIKQIESEIQSLKEKIKLKEDLIKSKQINTLSKDLEIFFNKIKGKCIFFKDSSIIKILKVEDIFFSYSDVGKEFLYYVRVNSEAYSHILLSKNKDNTSIHLQNYGILFYVSEFKTVKDFLNRYKFKIIDESVYNTFLDKVYDISDKSTSFLIKSNKNKTIESLEDLEELE